MGRGAGAKDGGDAVTAENKDRTKKRARALQRRTGWRYTECLRCVRELTPEQIEALIIERG